jgi:hypothetical protein
LIFIQQPSHASLYDEVVQKPDAELELNSTGSTECFIEAYAGIDLHSSNNYFGIINDETPRRVETGSPQGVKVTIEWTSRPLAFLTSRLIFGISSIIFVSCGPLPLYTGQSKYRDSSGYK